MIVGVLEHDRGRVQGHDRLEVVGVPGRHPLLGEPPPAAVCQPLGAHSAVVTGPLRARSRSNSSIVGALLQRQGDVIEPVDQPVADLVVDLERDLATGEADLLLAQSPAVSRPGERAAVLLGEDDRQQPYLRAVGVEDVGERRRDDRLEAVVLQPPRSVLARGAAAEVLAGDEDRVGGRSQPGSFAQS